MADFGGFNTTSVAAGVQGPTPISIKDMISTARGLQQYGKEAATLESDIAQAKAESQQQQIAAEKAGVDLNQHYANITRGIMGGMLSDPDFINGNSEQMVRKIQDASDFAQKMGVKDTGGVTQQLITLAQKDPSQAYQLIKNGVQQGGGVGNQYQTIQPQQAPALYQGAAPNQPAPQGQPQGAPTGVTPQQMGQPYGAQPTAMELPYPVRRAGQPYAPAPTEAADFQQGQTYRAGVTARQPELATARRNVDEVIDAANKIEKEKWFTSGLAGAATRKISTAMGDTTYTQLSKDLANVQIANIKAQGGSLDTVGGQQLIRMANGDETYPPDVLKNIARRTQADITNIDLQAQASQKFANKFGDNNMKAFQTAWGQNADSKVFEAMNIYNDSKLNSAEKKTMIDKLLGSDETQRKQFYQKYQNINKLVNTGSL